MPLAEYVARIQNLLPTTEQELLNQQVDLTNTITGAITAAVRYYSCLRPRHLTVDLAGDGVSHTFDMPSTFTDTSVIESVEYPANYQKPAILSYDRWTIYQTDARRLRLLDTVPGIGETIRVVYTAEHIVDDTTDTVPSTDFEAVCCLAASIVCGAVAAYYGHTVDPTIEAAYINYRTQADEWRALARQYQDRAKMYLGMLSSDVVTAGFVYREVS